MTFEKLLYWLLNGGIGIVLSWLIDKAAKIWPAFATWWEGISGEAENILVKLASLALAAGVFAIAVWAGFAPIPDGIIGWIDAILATLAIVYGASQLRYRRAKARAKGK
jgi:hypothetical protein